MGKSYLFWYCQNCWNRLFVKSTSGFLGDLAQIGFVSKVMILHVCSLKHIFGVNFSKILFAFLEVAVGTRKLKVYKRLHILFYKNMTRTVSGEWNVRKFQVDNIIAAVYCKTLKTDFWAFHKLGVDLRILFKNLSCLLALKVYVSVCTCTK